MKREVGRGQRGGVLGGKAIFTTTHWSVVTGTHWLPVFQWSCAWLACLELDPHWPQWVASPQAVAV
jgi:hypothetical protein